ncbi:threonine dehydratase [Herbihabitans rhizosphaerae]|uniref:threonine ammonia-lyase n=1 Tax=Herbihabitans rhizosphaerae TaxID=1872711 RepID=A0A4Q7KVR2_9PSEU|nr:threonine/serine dehydratase [Herbihabitans rhizosphaerae]RZS41138.1 threonine dehydratase [Herbihabitans rhizosphaerae]
MQLITIEDIRAAAERIAGTAVRTPLLPTNLGTPDRPLWVKPESLQPIGAFKIRGAHNAVARLSPEVRERGLVTYSSGNHAQAIAYAAKEFGVPATVVTPADTPRIKIDAARAHGAEVVLVPMAEREARAEAIALETGATLVPPFDHPDVIAGQGTAGLEIAEDMPDVELVLIPVSGGGLAGGIGTAVKALCPKAKVIGVEPALAGDAQAGFRAGAQVHWAPEDRLRTIADGLRSEPSKLTFAHLLRVLDDVVTVTEEEIVEAVRLLARRARLVVEPSGAVAVAAHLNRVEELPAGRTVAVVSGGNIDPARFAEILSS